MSVPGALKHNWSFDLELSNASIDNLRCYRCCECKMWKSTPVMEGICPKKDRRRANRRKWQDRRKPADDTMLIYACALMEVPCQH
jgi:hypothetical protein